MSIHALVVSQCGLTDIVVPLFAVYNMGNNMGNNMASNMGNTIGNTMGNMGLAGTGAQATSTLALPLQQQLAGQANFGSLFNANQTNAFGQQRQQPPPQ